MLGVACANESGKIYLDLSCIIILIPMVSALNIPILISPNIMNFNRHILIPMIISVRSLSMDMYL